LEEKSGGGRIGRPIGWAAAGWAMASWAAAASHGNGDGGALLLLSLRRPLSLFSVGCRK